jgi:hypothetical protein
MILRLLACAVSLSELLAAPPAGDWRALDPERTLYMELPAARDRAGDRLVAAARHADPLLVAIARMMGLISQRGR